MKTHMQGCRDCAVSVKNLTKTYYSYASPRRRLMELITGQPSHAEHTRALDGISFELKQGGRLGVLGQNGSGKSTLLKILAGVLTPTSGEVRVRGRVAALLELGAGFHPDLSGAENIRQFCVLYGLSEDDAGSALDEIAAFGELRDALERPLKTYSSGMAMRLGFACAVHVQPDILIVDEALSVGDAYFQSKCLHKIKSMLDRGATFIYVSHGADAVRSLCDEAIWLDQGQLKLAGEANRVGTAYQTSIYAKLSQARLTQAELGSNSPRAISERQQIFKERVASFRTGSREVLIDDIAVIDADGEPTELVRFQESLRIQVRYHVERPLLRGAVLAIGLTDTFGREIVHFNAGVKGVDLADTPPGESGAVDFEFECPLTPGEYGIIAGICYMLPHPGGAAKSVIDSVIDHCSGGARFRVAEPATSDQSLDLWGLVQVPYRVRSLSRSELEQSLLGAQAS